MKRGMITFNRAEITMLKQLLESEDAVISVQKKCQAAQEDDNDIVGLEMDQEEVASILDCFSPELFQAHDYATLYSKLRAF